MTARDGSDVPPRAGRREWVGLAVIALPCLLYSMDLTVLNLALPALSAALAPSATELLWIVDIYGFSVAGFLIPMGMLGDRIGRRKLLLVGAAAFGIASVLAAYATSAASLIALRFVLGVAGATVAPSTLSLIRNMFHDAEERRVAIGVWITAYSVGAAIGPVVGGALLEIYWWGSVFLVGVPVMVLLLAVGPALLPEYRDPRVARIDVASVLLALVAVLATIYGVKRWSAEGVSAFALAAIVAGAVLGVSFVRRQRALAVPMVDLRLFHTPGFAVALTVYGLAGFSMLGVYIMVGQYMQLVLGLSPFEAGLWNLPFSFVFVVGSMLTPRLARRFGTRRVMAVGLMLATLGYALLAQVTLGWTVGAVVATYLVYATGFAPVFTLATDVVVGNAPPASAGVASALSETGSELGGALGVAIMGSVGMAIYRLALAETLPPGVVADVRDVLSGTLGGVMAQAQMLSPEAATALTESARGAFVRGVRATAWVACAVSAASAWLVWWKLRGD